MKKLLTILLALLLLFGAAACAKQEAAAVTKQEEEKPAVAKQEEEKPAVAKQEEEKPAVAKQEEEKPAADPAQFKTIGDVLEYESPSSCCYEDLYIHIFEKDGVFYRVDADITEEISQKVFDIDYFDPDKDQKTRDLLGDLPIRRTFVLSEALLSQAELDALAGKTGQDLLDMGFVPGGSYGFGEEASWAALDKGPFQYQVNFAEHAVVEDDDPNVAEVIRPLTVKDAAYCAVSDYCTERDFDLKGGRTLAEYEEQFNWETETVFYSIPEIPLEDSPFKVLADVFAVLNQTDDEGNTPSYGASMSDALYVAAFEKDGACYRVEGAIPPEMAVQLNAIDFFDEERDDKQQVLLSPLPVTRVGDLSACRLSQAELDALVGKTGQELLDMGFEYGMGYSFWDDTQFYMNNGLFSYTVYMNEKVPEREDYDAVLDELFRPMTVQKVEVDGIADIASDIDLLW